MTKSSITRRQLLIGSTCAIASVHAIKPSLAARVITPRQTAGPFYPTDWTGDRDADLVRVTGEAAQATGEVTWLDGKVTDTSGAPIKGAVVEIWQCDANGVYRHPRDTGPNRVFASTFQGRGRASTDATGSYRFRTIKPVAYTGRTPHIHMSVAARGKPALVTQIYIRGEPLNQSDFILNSIKDPAQRENLIVPFIKADRLEPGALKASFNVVMV